MHTYLTMTAGDRTGEHYPLEGHVLVRIGRGLDCEIVLTDPLCSRVHANLKHRQGRWFVHDNSSLNGTYVNDRKVDEATLADGTYLRCGTTEFLFRQASAMPEDWRPKHKEDQEVTQTIIRDTNVEGFAAPALQIGALYDTPPIRRLLLLHQLTIRQLGCAQADEVIRVSLDLLQEVIRANVVGFLWESEAGRLQPRYVFSKTGQETMPLSQTLTQKVLRERKAVWVSNHQSSDLTDSLQHFADALCVPLVHEGTLLGAMHAYLERGRFNQDDFDFSISIAGISAVALARAYREERLQSDFHRLKEQTGGFDELVGGSPPMMELKSKIERLGRTTGCVLVRGESGTGKELVARALHRHSSRADRPMLAVNCAALPSELMESQLFGHKAGAFTGAERDHQGFFQQADGGTLFLDEAGELTLAGQAKLLRILEGHPFLPVGGTKEVRVDVRVIAATNQDLQAYVREKKFREDLYYRLGVFELHIPPLRERGEDVEILIDYFLEHFRRQHGRNQLTLSPDARQKLLSYRWPGNVRQLRNVIDSAVVMAGGMRIEVSDLGLRDTGDAQFDSLRIEDWEQKLIREALGRTDGNVPEAAKLLGLSRATLYRKLEQYKIER